MIELETPVYSSDGLVHFSIKEQTYRGSDFFDGSHTFIADNGWALVSSGRPEINEGNCRFFVRGHLAHRDRDRLTCTARSFQLITRAIKQYNAMHTPVGVVFNED